MSVRAKRVVKGQAVEVAVPASDVLKEDHPAHKHFIQFCGENKPTKRQARKFLQAFPKYREVESVE